MFEFTGQYYPHWVDRSYCPWFIESYVVGYSLYRPIYDNSIIVVFIGSLEYLDLC